MYCSYCGSKIARYPDNGICPNCGGLLPPQPQQQPKPQQVFHTHVVHHVQQPVYRVPLQRGINCCGRCMSTDLSIRRRGFSWGWGIFWFFMIPVFGIFLGFCGADKQIYTCRACGHKWKR